MIICINHAHTYCRLEMIQCEESSVVAGEVVEGLVHLAFNEWQDHYLEEQAFYTAVKDAKNTLLQMIEVLHNIY